MNENYVYVRGKRLIQGDYINIYYCGLIYTAQINVDGFYISEGFIPYSSNLWLFAKGYGVNIPEILLNDDPILLRLK